MTRTVYIVRHAKAEDRTAFMSDHDRELVSEGIMAAARMGRFLRDQSVQPDQVISSTAPRAYNTAKLIAEQIGFDAGQIRQDETLFEGGPKAYLAVVNKLPDSVQSVMIVGHNPDVSYFAEFLTHQSIGSISKGAVVTVQVDGLSWAEVSGRTGAVVFTIAPKELRNG